MLRKLLISLASLAVVLVLAEVGARVWLSRFADDAAFRRFATLAQQEQRFSGERAFRRHYFLGYVPTEGFVKGANRHNSAGFRGAEVPLEKPAGELRVACLGASTTYTIDVEDASLSYPAVLEEVLRDHLERQGSARSVRVLNAGVPGWTSLESLISLQTRVLPYQPDLIVVYHGLNDIHPRLTWPPEKYTADQAAYRGAPAMVASAGLSEHSALARIFLTRSGRRQPAGELEAAYGNRSDDCHAWTYVTQVQGGTYPSGVFAEVSAEEMLRRNTPRYYRDNLRSIAAVGRAAGAQVVFVGFTHCPDFENKARASSPLYQAAYAEMNQVAREVAAEEPAARYFDLPSSFPNERRYFTDGMHMNAEGAALKARGVARFLVENELVRP